MGNKNTAKNSANRQRGLKPPWPKGKSGNPNGHPKGVRNWCSVFRDLVRSGKLDQDAIAQAVAKKAKRGDYKAAMAIWDRMDGKPKETIGVDNPQGVNLNDLAPELRKEVLTDLLKQTKQEQK